MRERERQREIERERERDRAHPEKHINDANKILPFPSFGGLN
jgi:hypothetical protein